MFDVFMDALLYHSQSTVYLMYHYKCFCCADRNRFSQTCSQNLQVYRSGYNYFDVNYRPDREARLCAFAHDVPTRAYQLS